MKHKLKSKLLGKISISFIDIFEISRYADDTILMAESKEELKSHLTKVEEESEKGGLKQIMAFGPITSWQIDGETMEAVADFIFLGSKITADGDYNHEIKRHSLEGKL